MRILLLTHYFPPLNSIASHRPYGWARAWAELGHDVHVLTTEKYAFDGPLGLNLPCDGITVHTVPYLGRHAAARETVETWRQSSGLWGSIKHYTRSVRQHLGMLADVRMLAVPALVRTALSLTGNRRFDLLVSTFGPASTHIATQRIAAKTRIPWVADYRDLWTGNYADPRRPVKERLGAWFERRLMRRAAMIVTLSRGVAERLAMTLRRDCSVAYFGYIEAERGRQVSPSRWSDSRFHLVYTGRVYPGHQSIETLFTALAGAIAARPDLGSTLAVDFYGPEQRYLHQLQERYGTSSVTTLHGEVAHQVALDMQGSASAVLFFDWIDRDSPGVLTGKLFEYLRNGKPIVVIGAGFETEALELIHACGAGVAFQSGDAIEAFLLGLPGSMPLLSRDEALIARLSCRQQGIELMGEIQRLIFDRAAAA
ncbi:MAG: glycosyltransferase [Betaproteobacteria bacterium]|nr:glycosyltransferase [Betaproteobacteria bacterium]